MERFSTVEEFVVEYDGATWDDDELARVIIRKVPTDSPLYEAACLLRSAQRALEDALNAVDFMRG